MPLAGGGRLQLREPEGAILSSVQDNVSERAGRTLQRGLVLSMRLSVGRNTEQGLRSGSSAFHPGHPHAEMHRRCPFVLPLLLLCGPFSSHAVFWLYPSWLPVTLTSLSPLPVLQTTFFLVPSVSSKLPASVFLPPHLFCLI